MRFSASTGTSPASSCSSLAAEYFAAQPPHEARSVSLTFVASRSMGTAPEELQDCTRRTPLPIPTFPEGALDIRRRRRTAAAVRGEEELFVSLAFDSHGETPGSPVGPLLAGGFVVPSVYEPAQAGALQMVLGWGEPPAGQSPAPAADDWALRGR